MDEQLAGAARRQGQVTVARPVNPCRQRAAERVAFPRRFAPVASVVLLWLGTGCMSSPAWAHGLTLFATVERGLIHGEVRFHGGGSAANAKVTVYDADDRMLGETSTDEQGKFTFVPRGRFDHRLVVDAGLGHGTEYTIPSGELPAESLVADPSETISSETESAAPGSGERRANRSSSLQGESEIADSEDLRRQVVGLRRDLSHWRDELRFQDILGSIGYIVGVTGLLFYFLGIRQRERRPPAER
jgi:hypothetical protein